MRRAAGRTYVAAAGIAALAALGCKGGDARKNDAPVAAAAAQTLSSLRARPASPLAVGPAARFEIGGGGIVPRFAATSVHSSARLVLPARSSSPIRVEDAVSGTAVEILLDGARDVAAETVEGYAVYRKAHASGATLLYHALPEGTEDFLSFDTQPAAAEIAYDVALGKGVAGLRLVGGTLEMLDAGGAPRLRVEPPFVVGADGRRTDAVLAVKGCTVDRNPAAPWGRRVTPPGASHCSVHVSWNDREVEYPAVLDPRWTTTNTMVAARTDHTATLLTTLTPAKVLVACGRATTSSTTGLATAELFDPSTNSWAATGNLTGTTPGRWSHSATLLNTSSNATTSGKVLIAGGINGTTSVNTAQLYNPALGTWAAAANLNAARHGHTATLLPNGNVLVAGGTNIAVVLGVTVSTILNTAAIYNPGTGSGTWTATGNMATARRFHTATLLTSSNATYNNMVLVAGGNSSGTTSVAGVQLFNTSSSAWSTTTALPAAREGMTATRLANGNVLITGGKTGAGMPLASTLVFTIPTSGTASWVSGGNMTAARVAHIATPLPAGVIANGQVLVAGGSTDGTNPISGAELWNGMTSWATTAALSSAVQGHTATTLTGGSVLIAGGNSGANAVNTAQVFDPFFCTANTQCASGFCVIPSGQTNGVCCNTACTSDCGACNIPGKIGTCSAKPSGTACTADANPCTADTCDGTSLLCQHPAGNAGATCRMAMGECDVAETCTGTSTTCPADGKVGNGTQCTDDGNPCTTDRCDGTNVTCQHAAGNNGTACPDDGNPCTTDRCNGTSTMCQHAAGNNGTACPDDGNPCTTDRCNGTSTTCQHAAGNNGTACPDDGNPCTTDTCNGTSTTCQHPPGNAGMPCRIAAGECDVAETCTGSSATCPADVKKANGTACTDDGNVCTSDRCDGTAAICQHAAGNPGATCRAAVDQCDQAETCTGTSPVCPTDAKKPSGTTCNDANACTQTDTCQSGVCTGTNPVVCTALDQCHNVGTCNTGTGVCSNPNKANGTSCTDADACTQTDTCQSGVCIGTNPVVCTALDQCHDVGTCNTGTGICSNPAMANGTTCNDGNACTQTDTCQAGACAGSNPVVCTSSDQCHDVGSCNPASGQCSNPVKLDPSKGPFWSGKTSMATPRFAPAGVAFGGLTYLFGGCTQPPCGTTFTATVEAYDPVQDTWSPRASMPTARSTVAAATIGGTIYVVGGGSQTSAPPWSSTVEAYAPALDSWTTKASMQTGRASPAIGAIGGKLYVAGGHCCTAPGVPAPPDVVERYDPATNTWTTLGPTPTDRTEPAYGVIAGKLYVAGGLAINRALLDTLDVYDPATDSWTSLRRMPSALEGPGAVVLDGKLYVFGGSTASSGLPFAIFSEVYIYDPATDSWSTGPTMTVPRYGSIATANGATILLAGGYTASGPTTAVQALSALSGPPCNDGNACTQADSCQAGTCGGSNTVVCTAQDQCHVAGTCNPATGSCSNPRATDGTTCDDGNRCSSGDACGAGTCLPGTTNVCTGQGQAQYVSVIDLGSAQGLSYAVNINNNGVAVGSDVPTAAGVYQTGYPGSRGFRWSPSLGIDYVRGAQAESYADAINDTGVMSVSIGDNPGVMFPCRYDPAVDPQPVCQSSPGFATGINAAGTVTGWISQPNRMFRLGTGPIEILPSAPNSGNTLDARGTWIDVDGNVVGVQLVNGLWQGVRYDATRGLTEVLGGLLPPGSDWYLANPAFIRADMLHAGEIVGWGNHGGRNRAFRIKTTATGAVAGISALPMPSTFAPDAPNLMAADASNASGEIVGTIWDPGATFPEAAFVYTDGLATVDLNELIDPLSGWTLLSAWSINNNHQVVGIGTYKGASHAYALTLPDLSDCATSSCHLALRDPLTGTCSQTQQPDGSACNDGNACTQGDVCTAGSCAGPATFTCTAPNTCQDAGTCNAGAPASQPPSTQGLIGWWKLDGDGHDSSGLGHDLTIEGNVTPAPGRVGLAMQFDGTSCMTAPIWTEARMQGASGVTMMAWINPSGQLLCPGAAQTAQAVMGRSYDYSLGTWCYPTPGDAVTGTVRTAGAQTWGYPGGLGPAQANEWMHVTVTWDGSQIAIYVNGNANDLSSITYPDPGAFGDIDSTFAIGCMISQYFTGSQRILNFRGAIDEAMLYNRVLSPAEILAYYTASDPCTHPVHPDGSTCTDTNVCTQTDTCQSGTCVGSNPLVCAADQCHDPGACNRFYGCLAPTPKPDGTACSDGSACTRTDVCEAGSCVGANPVACVAPDACHTATCDPATGTCSTTANAGTCNLGAFDYDKAGRLIRDRGTELRYDAYDQLKEVLPTASPPAFTNLSVDNLWTPGAGETQALAGHASSNGHVPVQVSLAAGGFRTLLFEGNGAPVDLTAASGMGTSVFGNAMNDTNAVAGTWAPGGTNHAFRYDQNGFHDLGNPGDFTIAYDINNQNQITGYFSVGGDAHGYRHSDATSFQEIGTFGGAQSWAWRVDDLGRVAASAQTPNSPSTGIARFGHAALYQDIVGLQDLDALYGDPLSGRTLAVANETQGNWVVGIATQGTQSRAYRLNLSTGAIDDIGWAGSSFAYSVNSAGDAVGWGYTDAGETIQAAWILSARTGFAKLNDLIDPASGWDLRNAISIDDFGDVVGWGYHNGLVSAYRLRVPAHSSGTGGPMLAETHTYGYDGLRTSTTTAPGTTSASVQFWFTQDYTQRNGVREHYLRVGDRLIARVTTQPNPNGTGTLAAAPDRAARAAQPLLAFVFILAALAGLALAIAKRRRRWIPSLAGLASLLLGAASCEMLGLDRSTAALDWSVATNLTHFFHQGIAPGPNLITDSTGALEEERRYEPFGQPIPTVNIAAEPQNILGKLTDPNTGWSYHGARWMQPQTARWTSPDPAVKGPAGVRNPWDLNPYAYVGQNPVVFWDPDGAQKRRGGPRRGGREGGLEIWEAPKIDRERNAREKWEAREEQLKQSRSRPEDYKYNQGPGKNAPDIEESDPLNDPFLSGKTPLRVGDIDFMRRFNTPARKGDQLFGHELFQYASLRNWLKSKGFSGKDIERGSKLWEIKYNPAIALTKTQHDRVSEEQRKLGLFDEENLKNMSPLQNIYTNYQALLNANVVPRENVETLRREAIQHAQNIGAVNSDPPPPTIGGSD